MVITQTIFPEAKILLGDETTELFDLVSYDYIITAIFRFIHANLVVQDAVKAMEQ